MRLKQESDHAEAQRWVNAYSISQVQEHNTGGRGLLRVFDYHYSQYH
jgi:hypothetical protein